MTNAERRYLDRVAQLPCVCCGDSPTQIHHIREGQGMGQRASNWLVVSLCPDCHTGPRGIHGDRSAMRLRKMEELDLLAATIAALELGH